MYFKRTFTNFKYIYKWINEDLRSNGKRYCGAACSRLSLSNRKLNGLSFATPPSTHAHAHPQVRGHTESSTHPQVRAHKDRIKARLKATHRTAPRILRNSANSTSLQEIKSPAETHSPDSQQISMEGIQQIFMHQENHSRSPGI